MYRHIGHTPSKKGEVGVTSYLLAISDYIGLVDSAASPWFIPTLCSYNALCIDDDGDRNANPNPDPNPKLDRIPKPYSAYQ